MDLIAPSLDALPGYVDSLRRHWSNEHARLNAEEAAAELAEVEADPGEFIRLLNHPTRGDTSVTLDDGSIVPRLPGLRRWMWDDDYCGAISLRWQAGTTDLPEYCLGHIGYAVVPWKQRRGYATSALRQMLVLARDTGLPYIEIVTDVDNVASQRVVLANGGVLAQEFTAPPASGSFAAFRFRVAL